MGSMICQTARCVSGPDIVFHIFIRVSMDVIRKEAHSDTNLHTIRFKSKFVHTHLCILRAKFAQFCSISLENALFSRVA